MLDEVVGDDDSHDLPLTTPMEAKTQTSLQGNPNQGQSAGNAANDSKCGQTFTYTRVSVRLDRPGLVHARHRARPGLRFPQVHILPLVKLLSRSSRGTFSCFFLF